jgi:hypothetical protein
MRISDQVVNLKEISEVESFLLRGFESLQGDSVGVEATPAGPRRILNAREIIQCRAPTVHGIPTLSLNF